MRLVPTTLPADGGVLHAAFDLSGVEVLPDREAIERVMVGSSSGRYKRTIKVKTFASVFEPRQPPEDQVMAIVVDLDDGTSVELNPDNLEVEVTLSLPIAEYVFGRVRQGEYRYRLTGIRLQGRRPDGDEKTDTTGILFPDVG